MALILVNIIAICALASSFEHRQTCTVPAYVNEYAPLVYLHSSDAYRPSDIGSQLANTQPESNITIVDFAPQPLTLDNLQDLHSSGSDGQDIYLTAAVDIETQPKWLLGEIPDDTGKTPNGVSSAIIVNDHGNDITDVFYMYFFAYNHGGRYLGRNVGCHVGDWEHNMIRFQDGVPQAIWYSQHAEGQAFTYDAIDKEGKRVRLFRSLSTAVLTCQ